MKLEKMFKFLLTKICIDLKRVCIDLRQLWHKKNPFRIDFGNIFELVEKDFIIKSMYYGKNRNNKKTIK